jgi:hypothetical protein
VPYREYAKNLASYGFCYTKGSCEASYQKKKGQRFVSQPLKFFGFGLPIVLQSGGR